MTLLLQAILSAIAGYGIFVLWRRVTASSRAVYWIVTAGFLIRAIGGMLAFWISFLHLPLARSLQFGNGLWIFADDARTYFHDAATVAAGGPAAIMFLDKTYPSVFFLQALATGFLLFGSVNCTGILLNLAAYLGTCSILLKFGDSPQQKKAVLFGIGILSFSPSVVLWSVQPLKDVFFLFLVAVMFAAARRWQQIWETPAVGRQAVKAALWTVAIAAVVYGIAGIRFYYALIIILAAIPFALLTIIRAQSRPGAAATAALLLPLLVIAFFKGAGPYVPAPIREVVANRGLGVKGKLPAFMLKAMEQQRASFDNTGAATIIGAGRAIQQIDRTLGSKERQKLALRPGERPEPHSSPPAAPPAPTVSAAKIPAVPTTPAAAVPVATATSTVRTTPAQPVVSHDAPAMKKHSETASERPANEQPHQPVPKPPPPVTAPHIAGPAPVIVSRPTAPVRSSPRPAAADDRLVRPILIPASNAARLVAGFAALVLPRAIAQRLGILDVRGGRGLWLFAEVDTLVFDAAVIFSIVSLVGAIRRRALGEPVFWLTFLVTLMLASALAYTVSNFGTLFRHRDMIMFGLLVASIAATASATGRTAAASSTEPPRVAEPVKA